MIVGEDGRIEPAGLRPRYPAIPRSFSASVMRSIAAMRPATTVKPTTRRSCRAGAMMSPVVR